MATTKSKKERIIIVVLLTLSIVVLGATVAGILISFGLTLPCIIKLVTGLNCPGCGNTRAVMSLIKLDIKSAFYYNLMFPIEFFYLIRFYSLSCKNYITNSRFSYNPRSYVIDIIIMILLAVWTIVRNVTTLY